MKYFQRIDFGAKFAYELKKSNLNAEERVAVQQIAERFLKEAVRQTEKRLPPSRQTLKLQSRLLPTRFFNSEKEKRIEFDSLPFKGFCDNVDALEAEYRRLKHVNLTDNNLDIHSGRNFFV